MSTTTWLALFSLLRASAGTTLVGEDSCQVKVSPQDFILRRAIITEINCSQSLTTAEACDACALHHSPCNGSFVACRGCCDQPQVPSDINCDDIVAFFKGENTCKLNFTEDLENSNEVSLDLAELDEPVIGLCGSAPSLISAPFAPALVEFQCSQCNKGNPDLLGKCCDECVKFSQRKFDGVLTFVKCAACELQNLRIEEYNTSVPFDHHLYTEHTPELVTQKFEQWIRQEVCPHSSPSCPSLRRLSSRSYSQSCVNLTNDVGIPGDINSHSQNEVTSGSVANALQDVNASEPCNETAEEDKVSTTLTEMRIGMGIGISVAFVLGGALVWFCNTYLHKKGQVDHYDAESQKSPNKPSWPTAKPVTLITPQKSGAKAEPSAETPKTKGVAVNTSAEGQTPKSTGLAPRRSASRPGVRAQKGGEAAQNCGQTDAKAKVDENGGQTSDAVVVDTRDGGQTNVAAAVDTRVGGEKDVAAGDTSAGALTGAETNANQFDARNSERRGCKRQGNRKGGKVCAGGVDGCTPQNDARHASTEAAATVPGKQED